MDLWSLALWSFASFCPLVIWSSRPFGHFVHWCFGPLALCVHRSFDPLVLLWLLGALALRSFSQNIIPKWFGFCSKNHPKLSQNWLLGPSGGLLMPWRNAMGILLGLWEGLGGLYSFGVVVFWGFWGSLGEPQIDPKSYFLEKHGSPDSSFVNFAASSAAPSLFIDFYSIFDWNIGVFWFVFLEVPEYVSQPGDLHETLLFTYREPRFHFLFFWIFVRKNVKKPIQGRCPKKLHKKTSRRPLWDPQMVEIEQGSPPKSVKNRKSIDVWEVVFLVFFCVVQKIEKKSHDHKKLTPRI